MHASDDKSRTGRPRAVVMSDVGRLAGVSHQTVSRVINGSPHVRPETRQRVLAAMRELGYRPNPVARALVTGRSNMLGVVSFDTTLYGPASTLFGIERAAHEAGYFIIVASLEGARPAVGCRRGRAAARQGVDGILVIAPLDEAADALLHAPDDIPLVAVEAGPAGRRCRWSRSTSSPARRSATAAPARPRPRERVAHRRPAGLPRVAPAAARGGARRSSGRASTRRSR